MNCKHAFNHKRLHFTFRNCLLLRNKIQSSTMLPKCIHSAFLPKNVKRCPGEKLSRYMHYLRSSGHVFEHMHPSNNRLGVRCSSVDKDGDLSYSAAELKAIMHEFNSASYEALCGYGFRATVAYALEDGRPFKRLVEVLKVPGIGYDSLTKACRRVHEVVQQKKEPVQPSVTQQWAQEFKDVVSVCVVPGYVAYAHLTLSPAHPPTACGSSGLTLGTKTSLKKEGNAPLSEDLLRHRLAFRKDSVNVTALGLLPVETTDPRLHQHKLLLKVRAVMHQVPECSVYVMPVTGVMVSAGLSVTEAAITLQRAQIMGAVQGLLAQRCAGQASEMRYVRDAVVHDVFALRVGKDIITNMELLMELINGNSAISRLNDSFTVPRITMSPQIKEHFTSFGGSKQRMLAPALYTGLVMCSIVAATRTSNDSRSV